jgi:NAD(P)-dependent dehydrogenase (short-subunit alcohol dehydrogenase family)
MDVSLGGRRARITGAAAGIGAAMAAAFESAGARVHICDIDVAALESFQARHPAITASVADVSDDEAVGTLFDDTVRALGGLDIMVNNAGIGGPTSRVEDIAVSDWKRTLAIDLDSVFYCTRRAVPLLKQAGGGSIITLSSAAGRLGYPLRTPYSASKFAIVGLTETWAMELGPSNIRVNCIQPGFVEGERIDRIIAAKAQARGVTIEEQKKEFVSHVSLRTMVTADDIANMAVFLASDAGRHISGQALAVCGNIETLG